MDVSSALARVNGSDVVLPRAQMRLEHTVVTGKAHALRIFRVVSSNQCAAPCAHDAVTESCLNPFLIHKALLEKRLNLHALPKRTDKIMVGAAYRRVKFS